MLGNNFIDKNHQAIYLREPFIKAAYARKLNANILENQPLYNKDLYKPTFIEPCQFCGVQPVCSGIWNPYMCPCFNIDDISKNWFLIKKMI